jgi:hypothetical protein
MEVNIREMTSWPRITLCYTHKPSIPMNCRYWGETMRLITGAKTGWEPHSVGLALLTNRCCVITLSTAGRIWLLWGCSCDENRVSTSSKIAISKKSKAIAVTAHGGLSSYNMPRIPYFLGIRLTNCGEVVSLKSRPRFIPHPNKDFLILIFFRGWVNSRAVVRLEGLGTLGKK